MGNNAHFNRSLIREMKQHARAKPSITSEGARSNATRCPYFCSTHSICLPGRLIKWQLCNIIKSGSFIIIGLHRGASTSQPSTLNQEQTLACLNPRLYLIPDN